MTTLPTLTGNRRPAPKAHYFLVPILILEDMPVRHTERAKGINLVPVLYFPINPNFPEKRREVAKNFAHASLVWLNFQQASTFPPDKFLRIEDSPPKVLPNSDDTLEVILTRSLEVILKFAFVTGVDGGYSKWSRWSSCSVPCGGGVSWSQRKCVNARPRGDGKTCKEENLGPNKKSKARNTHKCGIVKLFVI